MVGLKDQRARKKSPAALQDRKGADTEQDASKWPLFGVGQITRPGKRGKSQNPAGKDK